MSFLAGSLGDRDEDALSTHVEECAECQRELDELVSCRSAIQAAPTEETRAQAQLDPWFQKRLQQTLSDPDWRLPPWRSTGNQFDKASTGDDELPLASRGLVPGYEVLGELGRGAMGVVYKARQISLGRITALKMILAGEHAALNDRTRFRAEAEAAGSLRHPNIVRVYETGEVGGLLYFSMEYIEGATLKEWLQGTPKTAREAALLLWSLTRAVDYAHRRGIVHRDLKPANVLLEADESPHAASETGGNNSPEEELAGLGLAPKITDFGLAKRIGETLGTKTGQLMGTPSYMSPEQFAGQGGATGPGVDIYALGCILYEALTGRPPFLDASLESLAVRVQREEPVPPRQLQPRCPRDLETICLKCLEKEPARRYSGAGDLAADLARFLAGEPIRARPPSVLERWTRLARRHRALVGAIVSVMAVMALGIAATTVMAVRESRARANADRNAELATDSAREAREARAASLRETYQARLAAAMAAMGTHDTREATRQLTSAPEDLRGWEWRHLKGRLDQSLAVVRGLPGFLSIAFCPPGERIAVADGRRFRLVDAISGQSVAVHDTDRPCRQVLAFRTQLGQRFVLDQGETTSTLCITDGSGVACGRIALTTPYPGESHFGVMAMSTDGKRLAFQQLPYSPSALVDVFDTSTGKKTASCGGVWASLRGVDFSPDGARIAAVHEASEVYIFDSSSGKSVMTLRGHTGIVNAVAYSPDGHLLASSGEDQTIRVWESGTGKTLQTLRGHVGNVRCVAFSPDSHRIVSGGSDSTVRLWSTEGGEALVVMQGHEAEVIHVAFAADGQTIASSSADGTARLWDASTLEDPGVLRGHTTYVYPVAYSPNGRFIASGSWDCTVRLWDAASREVAHILKGHNGPLGALAFSPAGDKLASWSEDRTIRLWDPQNGQPLGSLHHESMGYRDSVYSLVISPDSKRLGAPAANVQPGTGAGANHPGRPGVRFWDLQTLHELPPLFVPLRDPRVVAFSPDGRRLAAGGKNDKVVIVDSSSGDLISEIGGFTGRIQSLAFSPDGRYLLTAGGDPIVRLWKADSGQLVRTFVGHSSEVLAAVFHPDGKRIASGGHDRSILIWDTATGEELVRLPGHTWYVFSLAFSPDGETLVSGSGDSTVRVWDAFPVARRPQARSAAGKSLLRLQPSNRP